METVVQPVPANYRRYRPDNSSELQIALLAPPLAEPFQPSLSLPYLGAQIEQFGLECSCYNLSNLFYFWLVRRMRLESMSAYRSLRDAIRVLRSPTEFYESAPYYEALESLEQFIVTMAERDGLPYTLFPEAQASAVVNSGDFRAAARAMKGTLLDRFLQDFMGFSLQLESFHVIGFSAKNAFQLAASLFMARVLKNAGVPAHLVLGGHATALASSSLIEDSEFGGSIDSFVLHGGADIFAKVCQEFVDGSPRHVYTVADAVTDRDAKGFPTDRPHHLRMQEGFLSLYLSPSQVFSIYSSLGCSYGACTFCGSNRENSPYVPRQIGVLADEIQQLQGYGISHFNICDNNFDPKRIELFCEELERRRLRVGWQCTTRVYSAFDVPLLRRMREAGCVMLNVGLESADDRILKLMSKGYTVRIAEQMLLNMEEAGMAMHLYCICRFPTETSEESERTLDFLRKHIHRCHSVYFQDYEVELAAKVFADALRTDSEGYAAARMIEVLMDNESIASTFVAKGNLLRRCGYPFIEDHNFLYLARELLQQGEEDR